MNKRIYLFSILITWAGFQLQANSCELGIPSGSWLGETELITGGSTTLSITLSPSGSSIQFSDFSAGFFAHFGFSEDYSITLSVNCDGSISPSSITSDSLGLIEITSGQWDDVTQVIQLNWSIPESKIDESTTWTYSS